MSIQLTVMSLEYGSSVVPTKEVFDKDEITLGRLPENDVVLDKQDVSGVHARVRINREGPEPKLCITDLGSSNGTMVENNPISSDHEVSLENDERIIIGTFLIKLSLLDDKTATLASATNGSNGNGSHVANASPVDLDTVLDAGDDPFASTSEQSIVKEVADQNDGDVAEIAAVINEEKEEKEESVSSPDAFTMPYEPSSGGEENVAAESVATEDEQVPESAYSETSSATAGQSDVSEHDSADHTAPEKAEDVSAKDSSDADTFVEEVTVVLTGDDVLELDFEAAALYGITARVLHKGSPLEGVEISDPELGSKTTDSQGRIEFADIEEDSAYKLSASKEKFIFETEASEGTVGDSSVEVVFNARELFTIKGSVRHKGKPLADVEVDGGPLGVTRTDAEGVYRFENVPEGSEYPIKVKKPNFNIRKK